PAAKDSREKNPERHTYNLSYKIFLCLRAAQTNTKGLTTTQIADELENNQYGYDAYDDDVRDPDYEGDKESDVDMYESDEEEEGVNLDVVRRQEQPREEIRVFMDPPIERADGDTDKDSGEKKNKTILRQCCGS
ncbi:MAG: hypothetical protein ACK56F_16760, partial [bacterium]